MRRPVLFLLLFALSAAPGCQGFKHEATVVLDFAGSLHATLVDAPRSEQSVTVEAKADAPISVFLVLADDEDEATSIVENKRNPEKIVAKQEDTKEVTIGGTVPAKQSYCIVLVAKEQKTTVDLKIRGK